MKPWKARKYVKGHPVATKMFNTEEEAQAFADEQNEKSLAGIYGIVQWVVQETYYKRKGNG